MGRSLSPLAVASSQALETDQIFLMLLEIMPETGDTEYLVNNTQDIVSGGINYTAYPFRLALGNDDGERLPEVSLTLDNVSRLLVEAIRAIAAPPRITVKLVLVSQPDTVELEISGLVLREVAYDAYTMTGKLYADDILNTRYPADTISLAAGYNGLFR
ncbi:hypothetical protein DRH27_00555 [Candidatus Falkowbacteria bacterium]|nr:MAG: hypothetical protein DRH27_00555 [Candidatus Falkowbacteria bacterium]